VRVYIEKIFNKIGRFFVSNSNEKTNEIASRIASNDDKSPGNHDSSADEATAAKQVVASHQHVPEEIIETRPLTPIPQDDPVVGIESQQRAAGTQPFLHVSHCCHLGAVRGRNEDSSFIFTGFADGEISLPIFGVFMVADGMGGHTAGHEASRRASRMVGMRIVRELYLPMLEGDSNMEPVQEVMVTAVKEANGAIHSPDPDQDMGTTLTAAVVVGQRLFLSHVGDSRAYLWNNEKLEQLTTDHTYVQRLQDAGQLSVEQAATHPQRNVLYRAVGQGGDLEVDTYTCALPKNGKIVICSDGMWGLTGDDEIQRVLSSAISLDQQVDTLLVEALSNGGHDNITMIIASFSF
jgi:serine/threonine protein phosphatase PrpC